MEFNGVILMAAKLKTSSNGHANRVGGDYEQMSPAPAGEISLEFTPPILVTCQIKGTTPLVIRRFSSKIQLHHDELVSPGKGKKAKQTPQQMFEDGRHQAWDFEANKLIGWDGFNAVTIKACMVSAVTMLEKTYKTDMKLAIFVEADGVSEDQTPLIRIGPKGMKPIMHKGWGRVASGTSYEIYRPLYQNWEAEVRLRLNPHLINAAKAVKMLSLGGEYCGIGEHRASSRVSTTGGMFGSFQVISAKATEMK
jgi:hypothetical protein